MPEVMMEAISQEPIAYKRGNICIFLTGFNAFLYRQMIWKYGKARATEMFFSLWHKKEGLDRI